MKASFPLLAALLCTQLASAQPELELWTLSDGTTGLFYTTGGSTYDSGLEANVQLVQYSDDNVYVTCSGIPDYPVLPFNDGNPATPGDQGYLFRIPRFPEAETPGNNFSAGLGHIGILKNGIPIYNASDAMFYGVYERAAPYWEADGFDCSGGHPAPNFSGGLDEGFYHYHQNPSPVSVQSEVCDTYPSPGLYMPDPDAHSPLLGYAFDGFPIYGCYGYANTDGTGGIVLMEPSWQVRDIDDRTTDQNGNALSNPADYGPPINDTYPLGAYIDDHEYLEGAGHLDAHNGRFCVTPEYPEGTYAYFCTVNADMSPRYPYIIGPTYYGVVAEDNFGQMGPGGNGQPTNVEIDEPVETWNGVSVAEVLDAPSLTVYPNPATDQVTLQGDADLLQVCDLTGRLVYEAAAVLGAAELDVSAWPAGTYVVMAQSQGIRRTQRLLIAR